MPFLQKLHLPYRDDTAFGFLALGVFLVPLAFSVSTYENFEVVKYGLFLFLTGAALISFLGQLKAGKAKLFTQPKLYWMLAAFFGWAILATIFSLNVLHSIFGFYYRFTSGLLFYAVVLIFFMLILSLAERGKLEYLIKILVFDALVVALVGFASAFNYLIYSGAALDGFFRGPSLLGNSDYSAMFLACIFPLALYFLITSKNFWAKIYYGVSAFWIIFLVFILASRGSLLGLAAGLLAVLVLLPLYRFPRRIFWGMGLACAAVAVLGMAVVTTSRPGAVSTVVGSAVDSNTTLRLQVWKISFGGILHHPLLGSGLGNYPLFFERNRPQDLPGEVNVFDDAHNLFLNMSVTGGLPLSLLFFAIIALAIIYGLKNLHQRRDLMSIFILSSLFCWLICTCFNPVPIPMYLLLIVLLAYLFFPSLGFKAVEPPVAVGLPFSVFALLLCAAGVLLVVSDHFFILGQRAYTQNNYAAAYRLTSIAVKLNPTNEWLLTTQAYSAAHLGQSGPEMDKYIQRIQLLRKNETDSLVIPSNIYYLLYQLHHDKSYLNQAITSVQNSFAIDPYFAERYGQLALYQYLNGQYPQSKTSLLRELSLIKDDFPSWILLTKIYQMEGNKVAAVASLTRAFELRPDVVELRYFIFLLKQAKDIRQVFIPASAPQL